MPEVTLTAEEAAWITDHEACENCGHNDVFHTTYESEDPADPDGPEKVHAYCEIETCDCHDRKMVKQERCPQCHGLPIQHGPVRVCRQEHRWPAPWHANVSHN